MTMTIQVILPLLASLLACLTSAPLVLLIAPMLFGIGHMTSTSKVLSQIWSQGCSKSQSRYRFMVLALFAIFGIMKLSPGRDILYTSGIPFPENHAPHI
jgi:hypothetical protein